MYTESLSVYSTDIKYGLPVDFVVDVNIDENDIDLLIKRLQELKNV